MIQWRKFFVLRLCCVMELFWRNIFINNTRAVPRIYSQFTHQGISPLLLIAGVGVAWLDAAAAARQQMDWKPINEVFQYSSPSSAG